MVKFYVRRRRAGGVRNLASHINVNIREVAPTWVPLPEEVAALAPHLPKEDAYAVFVVDSNAEGERLAAEIAALFGKDDFVAVFTEEETAASAPAEAAGEEVVVKEAPEGEVMVKETLEGEVVAKEVPEEEVVAKEATAVEGVAAKEAAGEKVVVVVDAEVAASATRRTPRRGSRSGRDSSQTQG